jgi:TetR/AcrR family transcriptional regulator, mexJK operon transcriptional repressor
MSEAAELLTPERRASILAGAAQVFAEDGYEGASMSQIARAAGVSKGTLYNYFDSKSALFSAHVGEECNRTLSRIFDPDEMEGDPADTLRAIGLRMMRVMLSPLGLAIYRVVVSEAGKFPELARSFYEAGPARAINHLAAWIALQTEQGRLTAEDPVFAAEQFFALTQTRLSLRCRLRLEECNDDAALEPIVDAAVTMFLARYGVQALRTP